MRFGILSMLVSLLALPALLQGCEPSSHEAADSSVARKAHKAAAVVPPRPELPLDLRITPDMMQHLVVTETLADENQSQLRLLDKKDEDIRFSGRLLLDDRQKEWLAAVDGALLEIEVKTRTP